MPLPMFEKDAEEMEFILTDISRDRDFPSLWGFEVFTSEWQRLARFTYKSEREAAWAATNFAWVMGRNRSDIAVAGPVDHLAVLNLVICVGRGARY